MLGMIDGAASAAPRRVDHDLDRDGPRDGGASRRRCSWSPRRSSRSSASRCSRRMSAARCPRRDRSRRARRCARRGRLGACSERLLAYGQHFANELYSPAHMLRTVMSFAMPITAYSIFVYAGYLGMIAGVFSRRAEVVFVSTRRVRADARDLRAAVHEPRSRAGTGDGTARRDSHDAARAAVHFRRGGVAVLAHRCADRRELAGEPGAAACRRRRVARRASAASRCAWCRSTGAKSRNARTRRHKHSRRIRPAVSALVAWAKQQSITPDRWARALFEQTTHEQLHLTAETGLPTVHMGALPDLLLARADRVTRRRRACAASTFAGSSASTSRRRSAIPTTEVVLGGFHIREVARLGRQVRADRAEAGARSIVHRLDDRAVEIEVIGNRARARRARHWLLPAVARESRGKRRAVSRRAAVQLVIRVGRARPHDVHV